MKARPILFNGDMVRALLAGRKTQTRRVMKPKPEKVPADHPRPGHWWSSNVVQSMVHIEAELQNQQGGWEGLAANVCPHGKEGDLLWVRETWIQKGRYVMPAWPEAEQEDATWSGSKNIHYSADGEGPDSREDGRVVWRKRPSIHMPRWASRLTLRITDVRVERLQEISEEDAKAEGCDNSKSEEAATVGWYEKPRKAFRRLWERINGSESWSANPWVWVIEFEVIQANVDTVLKQEAA